MVKVDLRAVFLYAYFQPVLSTSKPKPFTLLCKLEVSNLCYSQLSPSSNLSAGFTWKSFQIKTNLQQNGDSKTFISCIKCIIIFYVHNLLFDTYSYQNQDVFKNTEALYSTGDVSGLELASNSALQQTLKRPPPPSPMQLVQRRFRLQCSQPS